MFGTTLNSKNSVQTTSTFCKRGRGPVRNGKPVGGCWNNSLCLLYLKEMMLYQAKHLVVSVRHPAYGFNLTQNVGFGDYAGVTGDL